MKRFAVIGLGQFGTRIARGLSEQGAEVLAIDAQLQAIEAVRSQVSQAIELNATDEQAFQACGVDEVDVAVVAVSQLEVSILVVAQLVRLAVPHIVARASSSLHGQILRLIGAHQVTNPEQEMGQSIAQQLLTPELEGRYVLPWGQEWVELNPPEGFIGKSIDAIDLNGRFGVKLVGIRRHEAHVTADGRSEIRTTTLTDPGPQEVIQDSDTLAFIGSPDRIRKMMKHS